MRIWINEICSTLPFRVRWEEPGAGDLAGEQFFATAAAAVAFADGFVKGFEAVKNFLPATPHFAGQIGTRSKFLPVAPGYGHTPREAHELNRPRADN
jgi:hypothetical protein